MTFNLTKHNSLLFGYLYHLYLVYKPKQGDLNKKALNRMFRLCEIMLFHYSRVFVVRIDLHPKGFNADNKIMSLFLRKLIAKLEKQYKCKIGYLCAREQHKSDKQHYHLALLLSGHKIQHSDKLLKQIKTEWELHSQGTAYLVDSPYYMMYRGDKASIDPVVYRLSYLTKNHTKERNKPAHSYLCNEIKLRANYQAEPNNDRLLVDPFITHQQFQQNNIHTTSSTSNASGSSLSVKIRHPFYRTFYTPSQQATGVGVITTPIAKRAFTMRISQPSNSRAITPQQINQGKLQCHV